LVHKKSSLHKGYISLRPINSLSRDKAVFDNHFLHVTFAGMLGKTSKMHIPKSEIRAAILKYNPCVYDACNHYPHYLRIYFDDHRYSIYAYRAVYWTIAPSRHFSKREALMTALSKVTNC